MDTPAEGSSAAARADNNLTYLLAAGVAVVGIIFAFSGSALLPNNWYSLFKAIHVTFAIIWVGGGFAIMVNAIRALRTNEPGDVVTVASQGAFLGERIFAPAGGIVFLMGIAMMINTHWGWGHFWVILGLLGYAATFGIGIAVISPLAKKIEHSAKEKGPEHPETLALIARVMLIGRVDMAILLIVILDMVTKPFA